MKKALSKWSAMLCCAIVCMMAAGLWAQSWRGGWQRVYTGKTMTHQVTSNRGEVVMVSFSRVAEDEYYSEWKLPYWELGMPSFVGIVVFGGLIVWRERNGGGRGFPV